MRIRGSDHPLTTLLMFVLGLSLVANAQAFTPLSGPVSAAATAPANVVLVLDNSSSMVMNQVGDETRLEVARRTAREVMAEHRHLRFGLFAFRPSEGRGDLGRDAPGGELLVAVDSIAADTPSGQRHLARLESAMDALTPAAGDDRDAWTWTPLAETYYEVTRYLRGMRAFYPQSRGELERTVFNSPLEYRCQRNAALLLTDGLPTYDREFPTSLAQEPDGRRRDEIGGFHLPDWDRDPANDLDGGHAMAEGSSFYLDDMAAFGYQIDLRTAAAGHDAAGQSWDDPAFVRQRLQTFIVGFELDDPRLRAAALAGGGHYASVTDAVTLRRAMNDALVDVATTPGSGGGAAVADTQLQAGSSRYYQTRYDPAGWSGSLSAHVLNAQALPARELWSTDNTLNPGQSLGRQQTWRWADEGVGGQATTLNGGTFNQLSSKQQSALSAAAEEAGLNGASAGQQLLDWARGQRVADLRQRRQLLGDVLNAGPVLLSATAAAINQSDRYTSYLVRRQALPELILLGANDGFVRAFNDQGKQLYAYLPATLHSRLGAWARPEYGRGTRHLSGVDGRIGVADVELPAGWSTLAAGGLGAGGKALFALQLLRPGASYAEPELLWEVNADQPGWGALGYVYAEPQLVTVAGQALLLTGNGYGSTSGKAALLVVDAFTGQLLHRIEVSDRADATELNGLAGLTLQRDEQGVLMAGFAGDQHGQLWKFDLSDADYHHWTIAHAGTPLFTAAGGQPISVAPVLHTSAQAGADLLLFGTGQFLQPADLTDTRSQAFYAVLDAPQVPSGGLTPAQLQEQRILEEAAGEDGAPAMRRSSAELVDWTRHYGWRLTLPGPGEKAHRAARIKDSRVLFSTGFLQDGAADPCVTRSGGWLMSLALDTGAMLPIATMDTNADGQVGDQDQPAAGLRLDIGLPGELSVLDLPAEQASEAQTDCNPEVYLVQGSAGPTAVQGQAHCQFRRILWRQLL
ncbi:PilC/PilY family type IV pilus protein [Halopseudomonas sp.]|uniref:PilC/PilY family type IV pilus protein n=1 Tax=Halopseudomonas sp. TaxID=2901191 RepID=UPI00300168B1